MTPQNYCVINGKQYNTGTVFIIDFNGSHKEATFICCFQSTNNYQCKINGTTWILTEKDFLDNIVKVTEKTDLSVHAPEVKTKKDTDIDSLFWGWLWYIFLMATSVIFKNAIVLWILISIVFFAFRKKAIKEEGTYIEW